VPLQTADDFDFSLTRLLDGANHKQDFEEEDAFKVFLPES